MLCAAISFAVGAILARHWQPTLLLALCIALFLVLTFVSMRIAPRVVLVPALAMWFAAGCWCAQMQPPLTEHRALQAYADGLNRIVRGRVVRVRLLPPQPTMQEPSLHPWEIEPGGWETDANPPLQSVDLDISAVEEMTPDTDILQPNVGGVRVLLTGGTLALHCGDVVEIPLRLRTPDIYRDPGAFSYANQLLSEGIDLTASTKSNRVAQRGSAPASLRCRLYAAQTWAGERLDAYFASRANATLPATLRISREDAGMLNAMLFGNRAALGTTLRDAFQRTGTFHLFVVSGLHVALLASGLYWIFRRLRLPEGAAVVTTIALTTAYTLLTGFGVPAQRALLMTSLYLLALWLDRESNALNALGFAACIVLLLDPRSLFESSFQMTFLVIVAIAGVAAPIIQRTLHPYARSLKLLHVLALDAFLPPRLAQFRVRVRMFCILAHSLLGRPLRALPIWLLRLIYHLAGACIVSLAAELCLVIPMAIYFHRATLLALPLNLLNIPLLAALLCAALTMFCAALISNWLAAIPAALTALLLHAMRFTVLHLQAAPLADIRMPAPSMLAITLAIAMIAAGCILLCERSRTLVIVGTTLALLVPLVTLFPARPLLHTGMLEITALDVGQGDSLLTVAPDGHTLLIDAGGPVGRGGSTAISSWDIGEEIVAPYLWSRRIRRLDVVALTHAHSDHMGGMPAVLRDLRPRELWLSIEPADSPGLKALLDEARRLSIPVRHLRAGDTFAWGSTQIAVLAPELGYGNDRAPVNNDSLVLRIDYGRSSALLEGDAEASSEDAMLNHHRLSPVTLLKVGHHGSKSSTTEEFLDAVAPRAAVISVGSHNTFGHPRAEVLERLEAAHTRTYRTDRNGAETFLLDRDGAITASSALVPLSVSTEPWD
jgi:competence protein ComEC